MTSCSLASIMDQERTNRALQKSAKKTLNQLHEQLLKKAGCTVSQVAPVDPAARLSAFVTTDCFTDTTVVCSYNPVSLADPVADIGEICQFETTVAGAEESRTELNAESLTVSGFTSPSSSALCSKDQTDEKGVELSILTRKCSARGNEVPPQAEGYEHINLTDVSSAVVSNNSLSSNCDKSILYSDTEERRRANNDDWHEDDFDSVESNDKAELTDERLTIGSKVAAKKRNPDTGCAESEVVFELKRERTKSRKALKPVKRGKEEQDTMVADDVSLVEIRCARAAGINCKLCSYACCSAEQLFLHESSSHNVPSHVKLRFVCRECEHSTDCRDMFERHVAHHTGQHTIRYYQCAYCCFDTNDMMCIEAHMANRHASDSFRFEVIQEKISYLQRLLDCPVCHELYQWRRNFLIHLRDCHGLELVADHLEANFTELPFPSNLNVPRSLFKDLLPTTSDNNECVVREPVAIDDRLEAADTEILDNAETDAEEGDVSVWESDAMNVELCDRRSNDSGLSIRFHCGACDFSSEDYNVYMQHSRTHSTGAIDNRLTSSSSCSLVVSAGATSLLGAGSFSTKGVAKTVYQCHLCPFECLKQVHYRRHLAIHERNERLTEGYRCGYCHFAHNRLNCVKFHLGKYHGDRPIKMSRIVDGVEVELSETDLYALRSRRNYSDSCTRLTSPLVLPRVSGVSSDRDKCLFSRYESPSQASDQDVPLLESEILPSNKKMRLCKYDEHDPEVLSNDHDQLDAFEQQLPPAMIYAEPVKCPRCDFTNRVRINLIRHLKLHKDEMDFVGDVTTVEGTTSGNETGVLAAGVYLVSSDGPLNSADTSSVSTDLRRELLRASYESADEKPLLRRILSEKPLVSMPSSDGFLQHYQRAWLYRVNSRTACATLVCIAHPYNRRDTY
jgi:uncharacterized C2H2 Zn-finger protein